MISVDPSRRDLYGSTNDLRMPLEEHLRRITQDIIYIGSRLNQVTHTVQNLPSGGGGGGSVNRWSDLGALDTNIVPDGSGTRSIGTSLLPLAAIVAVAAEFDSLGAGSGNTLTFSDRLAFASGTLIDWSNVPASSHTNPPWSAASSIDWDMFDEDITPADDNTLVWGTATKRLASLTSTAVNVSTLSGIGTGGTNLTGPFGMGGQFNWSGSSHSNEPWVPNPISEGVLWADDDQYQLGGIGAAPHTLWTHRFRTGTVGPYDNVARTVDAWGNWRKMSGLAWNIDWDDATHDNEPWKDKAFVDRHERSLYDFTGDAGEQLWFYRPAPGETTGSLHTAQNAAGTRTRVPALSMVDPSGTVQPPYSIDGSSTAFTEGAERRPGVQEWLTILLYDMFGELDDSIFTLHQSLHDNGEGDDADSRSFKERLRLLEAAGTGGGGSGLQTTLIAKVDATDGVVNTSTHALETFADMAADSSQTYNILDSTENRDLVIVSGSPYSTAAEVLEAVNDGTIKAFAIRMIWASTSGWTPASGPATVTPVNAPTGKIRWVDFGTGGFYGADAVGFDRVVFHNVGYPHHSSITNTDSDIALILNQTNLQLDTNRNTSSFRYNASGAFWRIEIYAITGGGSGGGGGGGGGGGSVNNWADLGDLNTNIGISGTRNIGTDMERLNALYLTNLYGSVMHGQWTFGSGTTFDWQNTMHTNVPDSFRGPQGIQGIQGPRGPAGQDGQDGQDGTASVPLAFDTSTDGILAVRPQDTGRELRLRGGSQSNDHNAVVLDPHALYMHAANIYWSGRSPAPIHHGAPWPSLQAVGSAAIQHGTAGQPITFGGDNTGSFLFLLGTNETVDIRGRLEVEQLYHGSQRTDHWIESHTSILPVGSHSLGGGGNVWANLYATSIYTHVLRDISQGYISIEDDFRPLTTGGSSLGASDRMFLAAWATTGRFDNIQSRTGNIDLHSNLVPDTDAGTWLGVRSGNSVSGWAGVVTHNLQVLSAITFPSVGTNAPSINWNNVTHTNASRDDNANIPWADHDHTHTGGGGGSVNSWSDLGALDTTFFPDQDNLRTIGAPNRRLRRIYGVSGEFDELDPATNSREFIYVGASLFPSGADRTLGRPVEPWAELSTDKVRGTEFDGDFSFAEDAEIDWENSEHVNEPWAGGTYTTTYLGTANASHVMTENQDIEDWADIVPSDQPISLLRKDTFRDMNFRVNNPTHTGTNIRAGLENGTYDALVIKVVWGDVNFGAGSQPLSEDHEWTDSAIAVPLYVGELDDHPGYTRPDNEQIRFVVNDMVSSTGAQVVLELDISGDPINIRVVNRDRFGLDTSMYRDTAHHVNLYGISFG